VDALRDFLAGDLQWSQVTSRYRAFPLRYSISGLGTSAARVEALL
jgi:hypothetical protein